ncbi:MAG TPA: glycosyltransferase, partial [Vicinamibacteria bacterium]
RPNLKLLGEVDYQEVPGLVAGWDVCLVPFVDTELTRCVDPVKVYEYLAAGRPVVATPLPELRRLEPGLVRLAGAAEDFIGALAAAAEERHDEKSAARRRGWASRETWAARAEELLRLTG